MIHHPRNSESVLALCVNGSTIGPLRGVVGGWSYSTHFVQPPDIPLSTAESAYPILEHRSTYSTSVTIKNITHSIENFKKGARI